MLRPALYKNATKLTALVTATAIALAPTVAAAQENRGPPVIRDTEAEQLLRDYTRPILRAAGLEKHNIQMVIINEGSFNAFVADGRRIFVNYGAMMQSERSEEHTSELQSRVDLVCRLLLEKKKTKKREIQGLQHEL